MKKILEEKTPMELLHDRLNEINNILGNIDYFNCGRNKIKITRKDLVRELILNFVEKNNKKFFEVIGVYKNGCYLIGDYYIGRTSNITQRISYHITDAFLEYDKNVRKNEKILQDLNTQLLRIEMLTNDQEQEEKLIIEYSKKLQLTNVEFNPNKNMLCSKIFKNNSNKKAEVVVKNNSHKFKLKNNTYDFINIDDDIYRIMNYNLIYDENYNGRHLAIVTNKNNKNIVGFYSAPDVISFISNFRADGSTRIQTDKKRYGIQSFKVKFIKCDDEHINELKLKLQIEYFIKGYDFYGTVPLVVREAKLNFNKEK
jgi:hypothetical protein